MSVQAHQDKQQQQKLDTYSDSESISFTSDLVDSTSSPTLSPHSQKYHHQGSSKMAVKFFKTKLCPWYSQGRCRLGNNCNWAHNTQEVRDSVDLSRTKLCHHLTTQGKCTDPGCRFAHRREELRATTDVYKTSLCVFWMRGGCFIGQKCRYAHGLNDLRHYSGNNPHRPTSRLPDILMLDSPKERENETLEKESSVLKVDKMGWNDPSLAAVAHALSSSGLRVGSRQSALSFETKGSSHSSLDTAKSVPKSRPCRLHTQTSQTSPNPNSQRAITQDELMTAMEALQSLLRVSSNTQRPAHAIPTGQISSLSPSPQTTPPLAPLRRKLSTSTNPPKRSSDAATSRLLAIAEKMTNLELASRSTSENAYASTEGGPSSATTETSLKDIIDSLSWVLPSSVKDSEANLRDITKRLDEIDVRDRARLGLVQELKAAAVLSVVAANATLTTAEDLNWQISDMLSAMRRAQLPWHAAMPSRGTDDQTTSASTHLGSGSERTDSVSNVSWRSNVPPEEASPVDCAIQEDLMLGQVLEVIRRTHTRV